MTADIQVFPLALLPGTRFRRQASELGLQFEPHPPYPVSATPAFTAADLALAVDYAESRLDTALYVMPQLDLRMPEPGQQDCRVTLEGRTYITALGIFEPRPLAQIRRLARRLTHPYQILAGGRIGLEPYFLELLAEVTRVNPYTPFEVVWFDPSAAPDTAKVLDALSLPRPQFLDLEQRFLFSRPGNRTVLFTVVLPEMKFAWRGPMERSVLWWSAARWPPEELLDPHGPWDGVLIDSRGREDRTLASWQDRMAPRAEELTAVAFWERRWQNRWLELTAGAEYFFAVR